MHGSYTPGTGRAGAPRPCCTPTAGRPHMPLPYTRADPPGWWASMHCQMPGQQLWHWGQAQRPCSAVAFATGAAQELAPRQPASTASTITFNPPVFSAGSLWAAKNHSKAN